MKLGLLAKLRNGPLLRFREEQGWISQTEAAKQAGISAGCWNALECLRFSGVTWGVVKKAAAFLCVEVYEICPEELKDQNFSLKRAAYFDAMPERLLAERAAARLILPSPADLVEDTIDKKEAIDRAMKTLTFREREALKIRYGLDGDGPHTYNECGKRFNVTRERFRQIEAKAIRKLRHPCRATRLAEVL